MKQTPFQIAVAATASPSSYWSSTILYNFLIQVMMKQKFNLCPVFLCIIDTNILLIHMKEECRMCT